MNRWSWRVLLAGVVLASAPQLHAQVNTCYAIDDDQQTLVGFEGPPYATVFDQPIIGLSTESTESIYFDTTANRFYTVDQRADQTQTDRLGYISLANTSFTPVGTDLGTMRGVNGTLAVGGNDTGQTTGLAHDPSTGSLYGVTQGGYLFKIDAGTGKVVPNGFGAGVDYVWITQGGSNIYNIEDIGFTSTGQLYGIRNYPARFFLVDKATGSAGPQINVQVGGSNEDEFEGFTFGPSDVAYATTGLYTKTNANANKFWSINLTTGAATALYTLPVHPGNADYESVECVRTSTPMADLAISKSDGVTQYTPGQTLTYTIPVSSEGPSMANGAVFRDAAVANLTVTSVTCGSATGGAVCPSAGNTTVAAMQGSGIVIPTLPPGGKLVFTVKATVSASATGSLTNTVTITPPSSVTDPNPGDNSASDTNTQAVPPLAIVKSGNGPWNVGQEDSNGPSAKYTLAITAASAASNVVVTDQLPVGLWPGWDTTYTNSGFNCSQSAVSAAKRTTVTCTRASLPAGTVNLVIPVYVDQLAVGSRDNVASIAATSVPVVNSNTVTTVVNPVVEIPSNNTCVAVGGTRGASVFGNSNGTFGTVGSNTIGSPTNPSNTSGPLAAPATTQMNFNLNGLADGDYNLDNRIGQDPIARAYLGSYFWTVGDHTSLSTTGPQGDPNARMMAMNASLSPNVFYEETLTVAPNSNYEFSTWAIHGNNPTSKFFSIVGAPKPFDLRMTIDRIGVDDNNNGTIDEPGEEQVILNPGPVAATAIPTWRQFATVFNSGAATQIRVRLRNDGPGGDGNDLAIDDLVMATCALPTGSLHGTLYYDDNRNNTLDGSETGRLPANIAVELHDADGAIIATAYTDASGNYTFSNVPVGNYTVNVITTDTDIPAGSTLGTPNAVPANITAGSNGTVNFGFDRATSDLSITKTNTPGVNGEVDQAGDTVTSGTTTTYNIVVSNAGPDAASNAILRDPPPTNLTGCVLVAGQECAVTSGTATCPVLGAGAGQLSIANLQGAGGVLIPSLGANSSITMKVSCAVQ